MITGYQALTWVGQVGSTLAALAALLGVVCIATVGWRTAGVVAGLAVGGAGARHHTGALLPAGGLASRLLC